MADPIQPSNNPNQYYQAPLEVNNYVPQSTAPIQSQPIDLYGLLGMIQPQKGKLATRKKTPYELMMEGDNPLLTPEAAPIQTNLKTLEPLDDSAGLFHSQDGFGKYGYSSIINEGDNEDRYSQNFRADNPAKFFRPGIHPIEGIWKGIYWGGGFLEKTLESAVVKLGQGLGAIWGLTLGNSAKGLTGEGFENYGDWLSKASDNILSNTFNNWDENLKERYHYFQEKSDRDNKGFIQSMGDGDFWMNDVSDGIGFLVSSMFEAGLVSKVGLGTKVATRLAPLAEDVSISALQPGQAATRSMLQKSLNTLGFEGTGAALVRNAVDLTSQTLALTAIESATEAQEAKDKIYASFDGKINPETGMVYSEDEKKRLAAAGAAQVFKQNMTILAGPKFLETLVFNRVGKFATGTINKALGRAEVEAGRASNALRSRLGTLASETTYNRNSALANIWKVGSAAALGFTSEGLFEENIQLAISRTAEDIYGGGDNYYRPGTTQKDFDRMDKEDNLEFNPIKGTKGIFSGKGVNDFFGGTVGKKYVRQSREFFKGINDDRYLDDELSKSIGIGGLFGVVGGAVHSGIAIRQQAKIDNYWNNRLNQARNNLFQSTYFYQTRTEDKPDPANPGKTIPTTTIVTDPTTGSPMLDQQKLRDYLNKMNNIQGLMDIIGNTEDPNNELNQTPQNQELNKLARNVLFTQLAMEYIKAGKKDLLLSNLASTSQFSDKDIQALGYEPGMMSDQDKKDMLTKMVNIVDRLDKADQWIENNVLDNLSEKRQGKFGLSYTKTQKEKRRQEFEAKKAYLRGLAMQNALLDVYLDEINQSEQRLGESGPEILSSTLDANGLPVRDYGVSLEGGLRSYNTRMPALKNQIRVLEQEFAYHWENTKTSLRNAAKSQDFDVWSKSNNGTILRNSQAKAEEALEKINKLQAEYDEMVNSRNEFLKSDAFELVDEDGNPVDNETDPNQNYFVQPKKQQNTSLDQLNNDKQRRINDVKREEISIQKGWIEEEWRLTAALKESKEDANLKQTRFSRRMSGSENTYNQYFQREVVTRDRGQGERKMKLWHSDESKRVGAKRYKANEDKLLKVERIQGKVRTILAEVNGQKLLAEIQALLARDLSTEEFSVELQKVIDVYNGRPVVLSKDEKSLIDDQIENTEDEYNFVQAIFEFMPEDERFNDKYYNIDDNGFYVVKPEYDDLQALANVTVDLNNRIEDLTRVKKYLDSIPETVPNNESWNNPNLVRKNIADAYNETADNIIDAYNRVSNNGQSEISGDSLNSKQDLDKIEDEINELEQLKKIFEDRDKTDNILSTPEFQGFMEALDGRITKLNEIKDKVKERINSRLRENQDFLVDSVSSLVEQVGLSTNGDTKTEPIKNAFEQVVGTEMMSKLVNALQDLQKLIDKEDKNADEKKQLNDFYWTINGQVSAIQDAAKRNGKKEILTKVSEQKADLIKKLEETNLMKKLSTTSYYKDIINNIDDSLLGVLQNIFYSSLFSQIGLGSSNDFLDDNPASPVYKFREDFNLRKFVRNVEKDNSRTPQNTEVTKEDLLQFLQVAQEIQTLEDLQLNLNSELNLLDQVEREKQVVQEKVEGKDNKYENLIIPSIQQLFFLRKIAAFLRTRKVIGDNPGFRNWIYIQAPGGAGKTQSLGTWFNIISGIPRDRVLATAFTEEASRAIKKALLVGESGPKDVSEMAAAIREFTRDKNFDAEVLIVDEFPAISVDQQKELFDAVSEYTKAKLEAAKGEFKVITMGDTNQLTFSDNFIIPRPSIIANPNFFSNNKKGTNDNHTSKMTIIPSLTVNFRSNIFAVTSFMDIFKGSNKDHINEAVKVTSTDPNLETPDVKGVVSVEKASFPNKLISYLKLNQNSPRTRALIVNEDKLDFYKKLLTDNGITIITDPNDEVTKGIYLSTVRNVQGFSFDEVFVDFESKDKGLFAGSASPNFNYNKAMYVAASRARNLIVVTNFPNFQNIQDDSINALESKSLSELQTKNEDFLNQRDLEINGSKSLLGDQYNKTVVNQNPEKAEEKVETTLDAEEETSPLEQEVEEAEEDESESNTNTTPEEEQEQVSEEEEEGADEERPGEVVSGDGVEDNQQENDVESPVKEDLVDSVTTMWNNIKDKTITAFDKMKAGIVELLFPTGQTTKYKVTDGQFTLRPEGEYENRNLRNGDKVIVIPFRSTQNNKSSRKFGYAVVTPAIGQDGQVIPNSYRTVSILSDTEIDRFKDNNDTIPLYDSITENEGRNVGFVSISYEDVKGTDGFITTASKVINPLQEGTVAHSQPIKYFYTAPYRDMNAQYMNNLIDHFIDNYYDNHLNALPPAQREIERRRIREFYNNSQNAQIIIPTNKDVIETANRKPLLNIPPELKGIIRPGRPYMMFRSYHRGGAMQFVGLSRKFLNTNLHNETLAPIRDFINSAKAVKTLLRTKGITNRMGYSRTLSNLLSRVANNYVRTPNENEYTVSYTETMPGGARVTRDIKFTNTEAERIYNLYAMYSEPNTQYQRSETEREIRNLTNSRKARTYIFEDGEVIYGTIESYDPNNRTYVVRDIRAKDTDQEFKTKSGVIFHTSKSTVGVAQKTLDDVMNSNSNLSRLFTATTGRTGFVTGRRETGVSTQNKAYKFMALLGSKAVPVAKSYNQDGTVSEYYEDIIEILEDLFNFANRGELPSRHMQYVDEQGQRQNVDVKFRVPVPLNASDNGGQLIHDYSYSPQNTSRDNTVPNTRYFETNFDSMLPTRVFVQFGETTEEAPTETEEVTPTPTEEEAREQVVEETTPVQELTKDEINSLPFDEIERRLTPQNWQTLEAYAQREGFGSAREFFNTLYSSHPEEQELFRDYLIECLL